MDHWLSKNSLIRTARYTLFLSVVLIVVLYAYTWKVLAHDPLNIPAQGFELVIAPGTTLTKFTQQLHSDGILSSPRLMRLYLVYKGNTKKIKIGVYKLEPGMTAVQLLDKVFQGAVIQYSFTIIEGWQSSQLLAQLHQHPKIKHTLQDLSNEQILQILEIPEHHLEGVFLPDTYCFAANTSDVDFLRRAYASMQQKLQESWSKRDLATVLKSPYEVLIMASIIEKETSLKTEYGQIAGVYTRRLQKNMKLQADPTVIYGLKNKINGPLLRKHLKIDSPYNSYLRQGLPPTPIALPSVMAIEAALHPTPGSSLYFVATGAADGGHIFSDNYKEHNKAVQQLYSSRTQ